MYKKEINAISEEVVTVSEQVREEVKNLTIGEFFKNCVESDNFDVEIDDDSDWEEASYVHINIAPWHIFKEDSVACYALEKSDDFWIFNFDREVDEDSDVTYRLCSNGSFYESYDEDYPMDDIADDLYNAIKKEYIELFEAIKEEVDEDGESVCKIEENGFEDFLEKYAEKLGIEYTTYFDCFNQKMVEITKFDGDIKNLFV